MTPLGLWDLGATNAFWLRFTAPGPVLVAIGITSALIVVAIQMAAPELRAVVRILEARELPGDVYGYKMPRCILEPDISPEMPSVITDKSVPFTTEIRISTIPTQTAHAVRAARRRVLGERRS